MHITVPENPEIWWIVICGQKPTCEWERREVSSVEKNPQQIAAFDFLYVSWKRHGALFVDKKSLEWINFGWFH